jgi:signal transduction histidine kinase
MVEDLQTLASAEAAGLSLERHPVDLATVAAGAADALAGHFAAKAIDFTRELAPAVVWADPHRIHQVISNLLTNAAKFAPSQGSVRLLVRTEERSAVIEVSDSGPGVALDEEQKVFERFFRGRAGRDKGGTGIGLSVVKELVVAHGGEVSLRSKPGSGACFVIRLPLAPGCEVTS